MGRCRMARNDCMLLNTLEFYEGILLNQAKGERYILRLKNCSQSMKMLTLSVRTSPSHGSQPHLRAMEQI